MAVYASVLDLIGNTPIVDVCALSPNPNVRILAKLEGQNPGGSVKDRIAKAMIVEAEADGTLHPGPDDHRAVVGQHRHRAGHDRPAARATRSRSCCPRTCRSSGASCSRSWGAEIILTPRRRGLQRRHAPGPGAGRRAPRVGVPLPVRQRGQPPGPLRGHRPRDLARRARDHPLRRRPRHQRHAHGRRHATSRSRTPTSRSGPSSRRSGELVEGLRNLDEGYIPPVFENWGGLELLDGKRIVRPRESHRVDPPPRHRGRHLRRHLRRARPWPARCKVAERDRRGHDRVHRVRRRLEVPLHRRLDRRPRRRRVERAEKIIYF